MKRALMAFTLVVWSEGAFAQAYDPVDVAAIGACPAFEVPRQNTQDLVKSELYAMQRRGAEVAGGSSQVRCEMAPTMQAAYRQTLQALRRCERPRHSSPVLAAASRKWTNLFNDEKLWERKAGCPGG